MKATTAVIGVVLAMLCLPACRRHDYRTQAVHVPGLKGPPCADIIVKALQQYASQPNMDRAFSPEKIRFDMDARIVFVEYDSMKVALKNIEHVIADAGFAANDVPADTNAAAKLPPECR